jgi:hypothetical protein
MTLQSLIDETDKLMVKFEAKSKAGDSHEARIAALAAAELHSVLTRWYGWDRFEV